MIPICMNQYFQLFIFALSSPGLLEIGLPKKKIKNWYDSLKYFIKYFQSITIALLIIYGNKSWYLF